MFNKSKFIASVFIALMLSNVASQACILKGIGGDGGNCAKDCEKYGHPYWLCMLGSSHAPQPGGDRNR